VRTIPQPDAGCYFLIRASGWNRLYKNIHDPCFTNNLKAIPVFARHNDTRGGRGAPVVVRPPHDSSRSPWGTGRPQKNFFFFFFFFCDFYFIFDI
jgi:hypothetical protein